MGTIQSIVLPHSDLALCFHQLCCSAACSEFVFCVTHMWLKFLFRSVLPFQWNRKIFKMRHEFIVWNRPLSREGGWLLITLTDFSIEISPALPIVQQGCGLLSRPVQKRSKLYLFIVWVSHIPRSLLKNNWILNDGRYCQALRWMWFNSSRHVTASAGRVGEAQARRLN